MFIWWSSSFVLTTLAVSKSCICERSRQSDALQDGLRQAWNLEKRANQRDQDDLRQHRASGRRWISFDHLRLCGLRCEEYHGGTCNQFLWATCAWCGELSMCWQSQKPSEKNASCLHRNAILCKFHQFQLFLLFAATDAFVSFGKREGKAHYAHITMAKNLDGAPQTVINKKNLTNPCSPVVFLTACAQSSNKYHRVCFDVTPF